MKTKSGSRGDAAGRKIAVSEEAARLLKTMEAIEGIVKQGKNYVFIRHDLKEGEEVKSHFHPKAHEWILVTGGNFWFWTRSGPRAYDEMEYLFELKLGEVKIIHLRPKIVHAMRAIAPISYFVIRSRSDKTIYRKRLD